MAAPRLKVDEWQEKFLDAISDNKRIDDFSFRAALRDIGDGKSSSATFMRGLAYCAYGNFDTGLDILSRDLYVGDATYARVYCFLLEWTNNFVELEKVVFVLADMHKTKWLFFKAASVAYALGQLEKLEDSMDKFIKMLSEDEGRDDAKELLQESIADISNVYKKQLCTPEQLKLLGFTVHGIMSKLQKGVPSAISISADPAVGYLVDLENASPEEIASLNVELAEVICSMAVFDDCDIIARFSWPVKRNAGASYVYP